MVRLLQTLQRANQIAWVVVAAKAITLSTLDHFQRQL